MFRTPVLRANLPPSRFADLIREIPKLCRVRMHVPGYLVGVNNSFMIELRYKKVLYTSTSHIYLDSEDLYRAEILVEKPWGTLVKASVYPDNDHTWRMTLEFAYILCQLRIHFLSCFVPSDLEKLESFLRKFGFSSYEILQI